MDEEDIFRPPDVNPFVGSLQSACNSFLMDDSYFKDEKPQNSGDLRTNIREIEGPGPSQSSSSSTSLSLGKQQQHQQSRSLKRRRSSSSEAPGQPGGAPGQPGAPGGPSSSSSLFAFSDNQFRFHFRMNSDTFEVLCSVLSHHIPQEYTIRGRTPILLDKKVLMCLQFLGSQGESIQSIAQKFDVDESSASANLDIVIKALNNLKAQMVRWPTPADINGIVKGFFNISAFPNVLGIMATTHIPILQPKDHPEVFFNSRMRHTIVLQAICDNSMKLIDCYTGWPGSVHDSVVLCESDMFREVENKTTTYFPKQDSHLLGASAYPLRKWLITPYVGEEAVLPGHQEFNKRLMETRLVAKHTFMLLKGRWERLKFVGMTRTVLIPNVIMASCILHNFCLSYEDDFQDFVDGEILPDDEAFQSHNLTFPDDEAGRIKREAIMTYINNS